jgi:hypothetical protein
MASLQPQDIVVAVYLAAEDEAWTFQHLSKVMGISPSQVHLAWGRLQNSELVDPEFKRPFRKNLLEFLCHGVKYCFPVVQRGIGSGIVTGLSHPRLKKAIKASTDIKYVWEVPNVKATGVIVEPIHKSVVNVARASAKSYEIFAVLDSIRLGKARERETATDIMREIMR